MTTNTWQSGSNQVQLEVGSQSLDVATGGRLLASPSETKQDDSGPKFLGPITEHGYASFNSMTRYY